MGAYRSTEAPAFKGLDPANGLVEELLSYWREDSRCLLISAFPDEYSVNDHMREDFERIFRETGLSLECMDLCDRRNGKDTVSNLGSYDMVILGSSTRSRRCPAKLWIRLIRNSFKAWGSQTLMSCRTIRQ